MKKNIKILSIFLLFYGGMHWLTAYIPILNRRSIENQIHYINQQLSLGQDSVLQEIYPEGLIFSNAIFALSIIDYSKRIQPSKKYSKILDRIVTILISEKAKSSFPSDIDFKYGAFYNGWVNFVLKKYRNSSIFKNSKIQSNIIEENDRISKKIINYQADSIKMIDSYSGSVWPADNIVCIASLSDQYILLKQIWIQKLIDNSHSELNLINHFNSNTTEVRGSSQALILYFLNQIDSNEEATMSSTFLTNFIDEYLGILLVKEHFDGIGGDDIDSGPILFGYGSVATIVNIKYQASKGNWKAKNTWGLLNMIGVPVNLFGNKYYLFKQQLMYDIFMLWTAVDL